MEITYIIPTCGAGHLNETINSISKQNVKPFDIIVVENGIELKDKFSDVFYIHLKKNYGYALGCNIGIAHCKTPYFALINDDAILPEDWAEKTLNEIKKDKKIALVSCGVKKEDGNVQVVSIEFNKYFEAVEVSYYKEGNLTNFTSVLISREAFNKIGVLEEKFFIYYEDVDFSLRAIKNGYKIKILEDLFVLHKESSSKKILKGKENFYLFRNKHYTLLRNFGFKFYLKNLLKIFKGDLKILKRFPHYFFYYPLFLFYPRYES